MKTAVVRLVSTLALAMTASILSMENSIAVDAKGAASKRVLHYRTLIGGYLSQSYELEVFDNGDVIYTGLSNVKRVGTVRWTVSPGEIEVLVKKYGLNTMRQSIRKVRFQSNRPITSPMAVETLLSGRPQTAAI